MNIDWINGEIASALSMAILHSFWIGGLIILSLFLARKAGLIENEDRRYFAHVGSLFALAIATIVIFCVYAMPEKSVETVLSPSMEATGLIGYSQSENSEKQTINWKYFITIAWMVGMCIQFIRFGLGSIGLFNIKRKAVEAPPSWSVKLRALTLEMGIRKKVKLLISAKESIPFIFGIFRPVIVFPSIYFNQLTPEQVESILIHELVHIQRNDFIINIIQMIIESFFFFNPAVWILSNRIRRIREYCCDDSVQNHMKDQRTYLEALYHIASFRQTQLQHSIALFHQKGELLMRVKRMLNQSNSGKSGRSIIPFILGAIMAFSLFSFTILKENSQSNVSLNRIHSIDFQNINTDKFKKGIRIESENSVTALSVSLERENTISGEASRGFSPLEPIQEISSAIKGTIREIGMDILPDTTPSNSRIKELQSQMRELEMEIDLAAQNFEKEFQSSFEPQIEEIEALAKVLENEHNAKMEKYLAEVENHPDMARLEELSRELELKMADIELKLENSIDEEQLEELERKIESKAMQLEQADTNRALQGQLREEMKALHLQMEGLHVNMRQMHEQIVNNSEIKGLREEMEKLSKSMQPLMEKQSEIWSEEVQKLRKELMQKQEQLQAGMHPMREAFQKEIQMKVEKLTEIQKQLHFEMEKEKNSTDKQKK